MTTNRREFLTAVLGAGFALSVKPVIADSQIKTSATGLKVTRQTIKAADGTKLPVYVARPIKGKNWPIILVTQEIFGVHEYIADVCRRLAHVGYFAVAPELYVRHGDPRKEKDVPALLSNIVAHVPDAEVMSDLDTTAAWAVTQGGNAKLLGIIGYCWGGRIVWLYSAHNPKLKAGVAWYGRLRGQKSDLTPLQPLDVADKLHGPVQGFYGGQDEGIPLSDVNEMQRKLEGEPSTLVVYPEAGHGFHADYRPSYRAQDAENSWQKMLLWFDHHFQLPIPAPAKKAAAEKKTKPKQ